MLKTWRTCNILLWVVYYPILFPCPALLPLPPFCSTPSSVFFHHRLLNESEMLGLHTLHLHAPLVHLSSLQTDMLTDESPAAAHSIEGLQLFREGHPLKDSPMVQSGTVLECLPVMWQREVEKEWETEQTWEKNYKEYLILIDINLLFLLSSWEQDVWIRFNL